MATIPLFKVFMADTAAAETTRVLTSGFITQGAKVEEFERQLAEYLGNPWVLTLNSATAGLTLALRLLQRADPARGWPGFAEDDVVLTPALTCFATTAAILSQAKRIRWLDVDPDTGGVAMDDIRRKLDEKTKVIYVVHWAGYPVDLDELSRIADEHEVRFGYRPAIVEDCAHAFGATFGGRKLGARDGTGHRNICVYSFQAIKHLTTGDGGLIVLPTEELYRRAKLLRWYGIDRDQRNYDRKDLRLENDIVEAGYKFHMNDIGATIGLANLAHVEANLRVARENAAYYRGALAGIRGVRLLEAREGRESACWLYTICVTGKDEFIAFMKGRGVVVSQVHARNDRNSCVAAFREELPRLDVFEREMVCIPVGWWVGEAEREYIVGCIREWAAGLAGAAGLAS